MHSSTSSSDRPVPSLPWGRTAALMAVMSLVFLTGWEVYWRAHGYAASYNDTPALWSVWRDRLREHSEDAIVIVGDSRIRFDLDHKLVQETFPGREIVSLAMNGSVARPVLHELAEDETFRGTVFCSYTPNLFWAPGGPLYDSTVEWIEYEKKETISQRVGQHIMMVPDSMFAFINNEDLALNPLLKRIPLPAREGLQLPPAYPPYMCEVLEDRRELMWAPVAENNEMTEHIKSVWSGLFAFMRPLPPELLAKLREEVVADVKKIEARGGEVIFLRFPSTDDFRELERQTVPREEYWEPLIAATGTIGIHFEDHEELANYDCPEWSHLTAEDSVTYTRDLMRVLTQEIAKRDAERNQQVASK